jgi:mannose-6-phosphate isomerase-like protein (cupin superfamily)
MSALSGLRRYAFAKRPVPPGTELVDEDFYFAIPGSESQYQANDFGKYIRFYSTSAIGQDEPLNVNNTDYLDTQADIFSIRNRLLALAKKSGVTLPLDSTLEVSHHFGIQKFDQFGTAMITVVNRDYCKKLIFMLPSQSHPPMFHKEKDETFFLLYGDLELKLDGELTHIAEGTSVVVKPGVVHEFSSINGAVLEEVSSTHSGSDSYYLDDEINLNPNRKTYIRYWLHGDY